MSYIPIIHIYEDRIEVVGKGIRTHVQGASYRVLWRNCEHTSIPFTYICKKDWEVFLELLKKFRLQGAKRVRICKGSECREYEL